VSLSERDFAHERAEGELRETVTHNEPAQRASINSEPSSTPDWLREFLIPASQFLFPSKLRMQSDYLCGAARGPKKALDRADSSA
jgi:hypothetical protein